MRISIPASATNDRACQAEQLCVLSLMMHAGVDEASLREGTVRSRAGRCWLSGETIAHPMFPRDLPRFAGPVVHAGQQHTRDRR